MSLQRILNVIGEKDFRKHNINVRNIIIKTNTYINKPKELNDRKMFFIYRVLGWEGEKKISLKHLNDFQFLIMHILKKPSENRFSDLKKFYKLKEETLDNLKFLIYPKLYPPGDYNKSLMKYGVEFYNPRIILKKFNFQDYIDLYSLMNYVPLNEKSPFLQNIIDEILLINPLETNKKYFNRLRDIFNSLKLHEKQLINIQLKNISYYHYRLFNSEKIKGVVIDGSNVIRFNNYNKIDLLLEMLDNLFIDEITFFPVIIVFDKNIEYVIDISERSILKNLSLKKRIYYKSPADEMIILLSNKFNYFVISNDQFKEYKFEENKIFDIRRFLNV